MAMAPSSSAARMRPGVTSMMRARPWTESVMTPGLRPGERPRLGAQIGDGHGEQRHADALARGEQHVELARRRHRADLLREVEQLVGGVAHGGDDDDDLIASALGGDDAFGDALDPLRVLHGRAAVLLNDERHAVQSIGGDQRPDRSG